MTAELSVPEVTCETGASSPAMCIGNALGRAAGSLAGGGNQRGGDASIGVMERRSIAKDDGIALLESRWLVA